MRRAFTKLLPFAWMFVIYFGTTLLNGQDPAPCCGLPRAIFETRHALTHLASFGLEVWLLCLAVGLPGSRRLTRQAMILVSVGLALGIGQETIQAVLRHNLAVPDTLWDLAVDLGGSMLGWWIYDRARFSARSSRMESVGRRP